MDREEFVNGLRNAFVELGCSFEIIKSHDYLWSLKSDLCVIRILFERFEAEFTIDVSEPDGNLEPMSFLLLRFLRGAYDTDIEQSKGTPRFYAILFTRFFSDLLAGDFSARSEYEDIKDNFYNLLFEAQRLPEGTVVKQKILKYDISWMKDMEKKRAYNRKKG